MPDSIGDRRKKLERLRRADAHPFVGQTYRTHTAAAAMKKPRGAVTVVGRLRALRGHGGAVFGDLTDESGKIQVLFKKDALGKHFALLELLDVGDFLGVTGKIFTTKAGEVTVEAAALQLLTKTFRSLPEKWHGLKDVEERHRKRYLDLLVNEEVRKTFALRSAVVAALRDFFVQTGYIEVETPTLQAIYGGTLARPFSTHHNALGEDLYLRVSDELYLKRLIVAGYEKVFEIGKDFRNEGVSTRHNPEFTQLETMWAYASYVDNMQLAEKLFPAIAKATQGKTTIEYAGKKIDLTKWQRVRHPGSEEEFEKLEKTWIQPTIVHDFPIASSPLAKAKTDDPARVERFEVFIGGLELANSYSELTDPDELRKRFNEQQRLRGKGDEETHPMDNDFIEALEYGMPPTSGFGLGVDRLVMLLTDQTSIREVILFPHLRSKK